MLYDAKTNAPASNTASFMATAKYVTCAIRKQDAMTVEQYVNLVALDEYSMYE